LQAYFEECENIKQQDAPQNMNFVIVTSCIPKDKVFLLFFPSALPALLLLGDHTRYRNFWVELMEYFIFI
jgi:hypothetical protein